MAKRSLLSERPSYFFYSFPEYGRCHDDANFPYNKANVLGSDKRNTLYIHEKVLGIREKIWITQYYKIYISLTSCCVEPFLGTCG